MPALQTKIPADRIMTACRDGMRGAGIRGRMARREGAAEVFFALWEG